MDETYVLIKEYPGSPRLGTTVEYKDNGFYAYDIVKTTNNSSKFKWLHKDIIENHPEFWQLQGKVEFTKEDMICFAEYCIHCNEMYPAKAKDVINHWITKKYG